MKLNDIKEDLENGEWYILDRGPYYQNGPRYELWRRPTDSRIPIKQRATDNLNKLKKSHPKAIFYEGYKNEV